MDEMVNKVAAAANKAANAARVAAVKAVQNTMHHNNNNQWIALTLVMIEEHFVFGKQNECKEDEIIEIQQQPSHGLISAMHRFKSLISKSFFF